MHVLQYITIQADNQEEAFHTVKDTLESELGHEESRHTSWFDWFVIGGGRFVEGNPYEESSSHVIAYDETPEEYRTTIDKMISNRIEEFNGYRKTHDEKNIDINAKLDNYKGVMNYDFELYPLSKMIAMIQGQWDFNSYFYDMTNSSTNPDYMYKSIDLGNKNWYAVPVDFHF